MIAFLADLVAWGQFDRAFFFLSCLIESHTHSFQIEIYYNAVVTHLPKIYKLNIVIEMI